MLRTGKLFGEDHVLPIDDADNNGTFAKLQRLLQGFGQSSLNVFSDDQSVDDGFNVMLKGLFEVHFLLGNVHNCPVDSCSHISCFLDGLEDLFVFTLFAADHWRKYLHPCLLRQFKYLIHHLVYTLGRDLLSAYGTVRYTHSCIKQSQIIVDFCDGTHC